MYDKDSKKLSLRVAGLLLGLAGISVAFADESEFGVNMHCADLSKLVHNIELNNGIMTEQAVIAAPVTVIAIPVTYNQDEYSKCLEMYGKNTNVARLAYFQDLNRCNRRATRIPAVSISSINKVSLASGFDAKEFEDCMHGTERKLEVELIEQ